MPMNARPATIAWSLLGLALAACTSAGPAALPVTKPYPSIAADGPTESIHGVAVADPYRSLEFDTPGTASWIAAQNEVTGAWLAQVPQRPAIERLLTTLWNFERWGLPARRGERWFYSRNDGLQNQAVLFVAEGGLDGRSRVLLDPNTLRADGTVSLAGSVPSEDGSLLAYGLSEAGSDWSVWRVRDVASGQDLPDELRWIKFTSVAWSKDGTGFFYSRFPEPARSGAALEEVNENQKVYFHRIGTPQSEDTLVYARPDQPRWFIEPSVSDDGRWLALSVYSSESTNSALFVRDLATPGAGVIELQPRFDAKWTFLGNDGATLYLQTDLGAPKGRVVAVDLAAADRPMRTLVPESGDTLVSASIVGDRIFGNYLHDAYSVVRIHRLDGAPLGEVPLPGMVTAAGFGGRRSDRETFFALSSYALPPSVWRFDLESGRATPWRTARVAFDSSRYETVQRWATSKDGTRVPMFVTQRKGIALDGRNPTILYGYGGFNVSTTPDFSPAQAAWLEMGGIWVDAVLRGGGEFGEDWYAAGRRANKQNVFDDFIACAEWLEANRLTSRERLAIMGGSNGGLLVGAAMTQRPELFGACLPAVGVLDMLRFHRFTIGWGWMGDYGNPDKAEDFAALLAYSPYHNIRPGICYPPTLITTADHDDRVFPAHSFKFAAALQAAQAQVAGCANPILIRIETRAGHGAGKPTAKRIEEAADVYAFLAAIFRMPVGDPRGGTGPGGT